MNYNLQEVAQRIKGLREIWKYQKKKCKNVMCQLMIMNLRKR